MKGLRARAIGWCLLTFLGVWAGFPDIAAAVWCTLTGEQTSGTNRICFYNCMGSQAATTVSIAAVCPIAIER